MKEYVKNNFLNIDSRYFTITVLITFFSVVTLLNLIEYALPISSFKLYEGEVANIYYETYECRGTSKFFTGRCEMSTVKLKGQDKEFTVRGRQGEGAYLVDIKKGDIVKIYVRHWFQYPLTFGSYDKIFQLEKGDVVYYSINSEKQANFKWIIISTFFWILLLIFFLAGKKQKSS